MKHAGALITAERLKGLVRPPDALVPVVRTAIARLTPSGWVLVYGVHALRSARIAAPRYFSTLDALSRIARECGLRAVMVELDGQEESTRQATSSRGKPSQPGRRGRGR